MEVKATITSAEDNLSEEVAKCACLHYSSLPKNGKPMNNQWTSMAAMVMSNSNVDSKFRFRVVSLGTGTKCLGQNEISRNGELITDSHAEVIARRAFMCYLYEQLNLCLVDENKSILKVTQTCLSNNSTKPDTHIIQEAIVKEGITFHLFISHVPCGDAAIFPANEETDEESGPSGCKKSKIDSNIDLPEIQHRTGAKLQVGAKHFEEEFQVPGQCRVKGGKGDPTLCMSCSDKMLKWQLMGFQGSLLGNFIKEPIRIFSIVIGASTPFNEHALQRAIYFRFHGKILNHPIIKEHPKYIDGFVCPRIVQSRTNFMTFKNEFKPAPGSIISYQKMNNEYQNQVSVEGRKHGITKKTKGKAALLDISRKNIFSLFRSLSVCKSVSYRECKLNSVCYNIWLGIKQDILKGWTEKPEITLQFEG